MKDRWIIEYPTVEEQQNHIATIVSKGLVKPKAFHESLLEMYKQIGFRHLFRDATEILFVLAIAAGMCGFGLFQAMNNDVDVDRVYFYIFTLSPILYMIIALAFLLNLRDRDTFELEMTCKFHVFQIAAFRMLVFSIVAIIVNICMVVLMSMIYQSLNLFEALGISISSLSVFAMAWLYIFQKAKSKVATYLLIGGWLLLNFIPALYSYEFYSIFLSRIPLSIYIVVSAASIYVYIRRLNYFMAFHNATGGL